ncbi:hypothetical protein ACWD0J_31530 [Streptomyces sp. NPDC003011]
MPVSVDLDEVLDSRFEDENVPLEQVRDTPEAVSAGRGPGDQCRGTLETPRIATIGDPGAPTRPAGRSSGPARKTTPTDDHPH